MFVVNGFFDSGRVPDSEAFREWIRPEDVISRLVYSVPLKQVDFQMDYLASWRNFFSKDQSFNVARFDMDVANALTVGLLGAPAILLFYMAAKRLPADLARRASETR